MENFLLVQNFAELLLSRPLKEILNLFCGSYFCGGQIICKILHHAKISCYIQYTKRDTFICEIYNTYVMGNFCWCKISLNCYPDLQNVVLIFAAAKLSAKFWAMLKFPAIQYSIYVWDLFTWIMWVKSQSHKFVPHKFLSGHTLQCISARTHYQEAHFDKYKFVTCIKMLLYGT